MSEEQLEIPVDEQAHEIEPELQAEGEETELVESETPEGETPAETETPAAEATPAFDDPKLQARYDAAMKLASSGDVEDIEASNKLLDKISIELGLMEKPEPAPALVRPPTPEPEDDNLTAHESRNVKADIEFRKSEFGVTSAIHQTSQLIKDSNDKCDKIYIDWQKAVAADGNESYGAKLLSNQWNVERRAAEQHEQFLRDCQANKDLLETVVKPNIQQMPWLEPIKDRYLEAIVKRLVNPLADQDTQRQQLIRAGLKFPAPKAKAAAAPAQTDSAKAAIERVRQMNSLAKKKGSGGVAPKAAQAAAAKAKVSVSAQRFTAAQLAEYRNNGGRFAQALIGT